MSHIDGTVEIYGRGSTYCYRRRYCGESNINLECDCPYCHNDELACGHIGVLLLKFYSLEMSEIPFQFNQKIDYKAKIEAFERVREEKLIQTKLEESKLITKLH